jgi:hypothetical protein
MMICQSIHVEIDEEIMMVLSFEDGEENRLGGLGGEDMLEVIEVTWKGVEGGRGGQLDGTLAAISHYYELNFITVSWQGGQGGKEMRR